MGKSLFGIGTTVCVLAVIAVVAGRNHHDESGKAVQPPLRQEQAVHGASDTEHAVLQGAAPETPPAKISIAPLPANAAFVPDENLLQLSALVDLPNAADRDIDKSRWPQAISIAEALAQGPCDCEQRNWLNHFIEMGNDAISGADDAYYKLAGLMVRMARNDKQLSRDPGQVLR